jgi:multisubunit Na+/H+ antiporter MnhB subunit
MKAAQLLVIALFGALLVYGTSDLPYRGLADNRMHSDVSMSGTPVAGNYYIRNAYRDAKTPNMVTVILGDYRSVDTLGEEVVIFTAGLITVLVLRRRKDS